MKIMPRESTRLPESVVALPVLEAVMPRALVALRSPVKLEILLLTMLSASVRRRMTLAVFSWPNSGALVAESGMT
jgi:hypothetical protein